MLNKTTSRTKYFLYNLILKIAFLLITLLFNIILTAQSGSWTWVHGSNATNSLGNYGTMGVASPTNEPPALYEACEWTDSQGRFWLYGGIDQSAGYFSALWMYNPGNNMWTWMNGPTTPGAPAVHGTQGIPSPSNHPGARGYAPTTWVDAQDNLWMFGGSSGSFNASGYLNHSDLWKYNITTNMWTWISGSANKDPFGVYGTQGVAATTNYPPGRQECAASWVDNTGNLWLFGGSSLWLNGGGDLNDLWKYNPGTNEWTWMRGSNGINSLGNYGTKGVASATNDPPARFIYSRWKDRNGNLWLFGGKVSLGFLNDLWKYDIITNQWTWIRGSNSVSPPDIASTKCQPLATDEPPARYESRTCWTDLCNNFWLFGGSGALLYNDLWHYNVQTNIWTLVDDNLPGGMYGTINTPSVANQPPEKMGAVPYTSKNGNLWLFGGNGNYNDLWRYEIDSNCVKWCAPPLTVIAGFSGTNLKDCANLTVNFTNTSTNSTSWNWNFGDGGMSTLKNPNHTYTTPGQYTVSLVASNGTTSSTSVLTNYVTVYPNAVASFTSSSDTICVGQNVSFTNTSSNSNTSSWNFGDGNSSLLISPSHSYAAVGNYTVTLIAQNTNGCNDTISQNIFVTATNVSIGNPLVLTCTTTSGIITATSITNNATYTWNGPGIISGTTNDTATVNAAGTYTVTVTDPITGCTNTATVTVTINNIPPNISVGPPLVLTNCVGSSGIISVSSTTAGVTYSWNGNGIVSGATNDTATVNSTGTYTVNVTDPNNGCNNSATVNVTSNTPLPNVSVTPTIISCNQPTIFIVATSTTTNVTYNWSGPGIVSGSTTQNPTVNQTGTYTVTVTDPLTGCSNTATVIVTNGVGPTATISSNVTIQQGQSTILTAGGGTYYNWFPVTNLNPTIGNTVTANPNQTTTYCVEVTDNIGCKDTACITVIVEIPCPANEYLQVPNAFSPNNDNVNDEFCLKGWDQCIIDFTIIIFNRWGEKVFESTNPDFCWDGLYNGKIMDAQVFVYYINASFQNSRASVIKKGNLSLLR